MAWATELNIIRRYLRDPDANIWSNDLLMGLYNQAQNELQQRSGILEDVAGVYIPPMFNASYMQDWEYGHISGTAKYRCLRNNGNNFTCCYRWEIQQNYGTAGDTPDEGIAYSHPWEAFAGETPNMPPAIPLPRNTHTIKAMFHDSWPIPAELKKRISADDPSWVTRSGTPLSYYQEDTTSNQFYLYGQPSTITWTDEDGSGPVTSVEDYTVGSETGTITQITGGLLSGESGIDVSVVGDDNNILMVYDITPVDIESVGDESDFPQYLNKYIRYRVLQLAYSANTDGRIQSLGEYWGQRAIIGLKIVIKFMQNRFRDRDYCLKTQDRRPARNIRHPRLPSTYPAI